MWGFDLNGPMYNLLLCSALYYLVQSQQSTFWVVIVMMAVYSYMAGSLLQAIWCSCMPVVPIC